MNNDHITIVIVFIIITSKNAYESPNLLAKFFAILYRLMRIQRAKKPSIQYP